MKPLSHKKSSTTHESRLIHQEQVLLKRVFSSIFTARIPVGFYAFNIEPDNLSIELTNGDKVAKDFAKISFAKDFEIYVQIRATGIKNKRIDKIIHNMKNKNVKDITIRCDSDHGGNINYSIVRTCLTLFPTENINCSLHEMHITDRMFIKLVKRCCRVNIIAFYGCIIERIDSTCLLGKKAALKVLFLYNCNDTQGSKIEQGDTLESILRFVSETTLITCLSEIRFFETTSKSKIQDLKSKYYLQKLKFTKFSFESFSYKEFV
ncbi:unnamed protein product [Moneuplotes crassus]|uniref:Uncharacterized protein n=1 Tax=Euplotes crassus TaxID=5936 RepID=A0AAD1XNH7_EUPCR|nr:unnamed protein product [Moneuplotes crassus]